jgi:thymidylate synthase
MMCEVLGAYPGRMVYNITNAHIYENHIEQAYQVIKRIPYDFPTLSILYNGQKIDEFVYEDFRVSNYQCHPPIYAPLNI